jgi:cysteinyl-tRNA synthetase
VDEYDKADARDFVLWKASREGEPVWETEVGPGRPGWHIECSAMAMKYLGETLDIHAGGVDLIFPHHENEIAQSEAITHKPFARFWLHSQHLTVESQKMSKSAGNFFTLRELLEQGYAPEVIRYALLKVPYRSKLNFTFDELKGAKSSIDRLRSFQLRLDTDKPAEGVNEEIEKRTAEALAQFEASLDNDLNTAEAIAAIFEYIRDANTAMDAGEFLAGNVASARDLLSRFDCIAAVLQPSEQKSGLTEAQIELRINERNQAKKAREFARADRIRAELLEMGIVIEDTREGVRWKRSS